MAGAVEFAVRQHAHILVAVLIVAPFIYGVALLGVGAIGRQDFDLILQLFKKKLSTG